MRSRSRLPDHIPLPILLGCVVLALALVGIGTWVFLGAGSDNQNHIPGHVATATPISAGIPSQSNTSVSPLLFGTNLSLYDANDQFLTSASTRISLQQLHLQIIRMPIRTQVAESINIQAAQTIKSIGATPLIILHGANDANALADDMPVVKDMNSVFGNGTVYYEFGNENDLNGIPVDRYTAAWNQVVPQLKQAAPHGQFIGPVNFQYAHNYLTAFLQQAQPRPDAISWHEYTCDDKEPADACITNITKWTRHVQDARSVMKSTINTVLPIMITEWNYAPNAVPNDGKNNDSTFMKTWTATALQTLAANRVFASMQYACTHPIMPLVTNSGALSAQGQVFLRLYQQMIINKQQPAAIATEFPAAQSTSASGSAAASGPIAFSFEDGSTDGWSAHGQGISNLQNSTAVAQDGTHSLHVSLTNASSNAFPYVSVDLDSVASPLKAGQTVTAYVYSQSNAVSLTAKIFVMGSDYQWHSDAVVPLTPGSWTRLTFTLPSTLEKPTSLGIQFNCTTGVGTPSDVFVDAVGWG